MDKDLKELLDFAEYFNDKIGDFLDHGIFPGTLSISLGDQKLDLDWCPEIVDSVTDLLEVQADLLTEDNEPEPAPEPEPSIEIPKCATCVGVCIECKGCDGPLPDIKLCEEYCDTYPVCARENRL